MKISENMILAIGKSMRMNRLFLGQTLVTLVSL
jgi:hypothetical protein